MSARALGRTGSMAIEAHKVPRRSGWLLAATLALAVSPIMARAGPAEPSAPMVSLAELLQRPASAQLRWSRFKASPAIIVIEYPNLHEQGLAMNRLAAMFEKRAAPGQRVLAAAELDELMRRSGDNVATFYQGHDYPA